MNEASTLASHAVASAEEAPGQARPASFEWPIPPGATANPVWTGTDFLIGEDRARIVSYTTQEAGWNHGLTEFHEATAGEDHFIDRASRQTTLRLLRRYSSPDQAVILEVGSSSGFLLNDLAVEFPKALVIGSDAIFGALDGGSALLRGIPLIHFDLVQCPLPDNAFDAVVLANVLEHIEDDQSALNQVERILKPGGLALIEVPAGPELFDVYDSLLMHFRRYSMRGLLELAQNAGLTPVFRSHLGFSLFPGFWACKKWRRRALLADPKPDAAVARRIRATRRSWLLDMVMRLEMGLAARLSYPCGIRCVLVCKKPCE